MQTSEMNETGNQSILESFGDFDKTKRSEIREAAQEINFEAQSSSERSQQLEIGSADSGNFKLDHLDESLSEANEFVNASPEMRKANNSLISDRMMQLSDRANMKKGLTTKQIESSRKSEKSGSIQQSVAMSNHIKNFDDFSEENKEDIKDEEDSPNKSQKVLETSGKQKPQISARSGS